MQIINKDLGSYNVHFIKTDNFRTVTMRVVFHRPIDKHDITSRNVLANILLQSTKKYNSKRDLTIKSEELYASDVYSTNQRIGNYILTSFILQSLNDKYTEDGNFSKAIKFLHDIIFSPDVSGNKFKQSKLDLVKANVLVNMNSIKEDPSYYAMVRMNEAYDKSSPISYRMVGYRDDLESIDVESLYNTYSDMINDDYVDIFIVGDVDSDKLLPIIKKYFKFRKVKKRKGPYMLDYKSPRKNRLICRETTNNSQSNLVIGIDVSKMKDFDRDYSLLLGNIILGGNSDSKLFMNVRESNSLCYSISSFYNKMDHLMTISAGIDRENYESCLSLIDANLEDMKKGRFSDSDLEKAKEYFNNSASTLMESPIRIINEAFTEEVLGAVELSERVKAINSVTRRDVMRSCRKLNIDTVFLLEGGDVHE